MPCDTIQTTACDMQHANIPILMDALKRLGLNPKLAQDGKSITWRGGQWQNGKITTRGGYGTLEAEDVRKEYAKEVVGFAAKQFGWKLQEKQTVQRKGVIATFEAKKR